MNYAIYLTNGNIIEGKDRRSHAEIVHHWMEAVKISIEAEKAEKKEEAIGYSERDSETFGFDKSTLFMLYGDDSGEGAVAIHAVTIMGISKESQPIPPKPPLDVEELLNKMIEAKAQGKL